MGAANASSLLFCFFLQFLRGAPSSPSAVTFSVRLAWHHANRALRFAIPPRLTH
jgi:hypothetical protein